MLYLLAGFYGLLIGNFVTSAYFRIPREIAINGLNNKIGKVPHCSSCGHKLQFYEYLPLLSWIFTFFRCNYCNAKIDPVYIILEMGMTLVSLVLLYLIGLNDLYVSYVMVAAALALNIALFYSQHKFYKKAIYILLASIVIYGIILIF